MHKLRFLLILILTWVTPLQAQRNCATEKLDSIRRWKHSTLESKDDFESWMSNQLLRKNSNNRTQSTYTIPVVVHIIHSGQPLGTGSHLTDAQVLSQIRVLNEDFQRLNADASQTPSIFLPFAGSLSVAFVLAKQDPQGNATTGIVRVNGGKPSWNLYQDTELKALSYWPAENYFNVWVTSFNDYLGYAQLPISNLGGLSEPSEDRLTDGVIVHHRAFGSIDDGAFDLEPQFNKGRTLTHEAGHFFGLRHIWGDGNSCSATDYVNDTPAQVGETSGCPSHPQTQCSGSKMFQNYMDYTDDRCMNIFTVGQFNRMEVVLQNSPRRASLLTSPGANLPGNFSLDLGIVSALEPASLECSGNHTPTLSLRNFGASLITSASLEMKINNVVIQTLNVALNLNALQQSNISFNSYTSAPGEIRNFSFNILSVNGVADEYVGNNQFNVMTKTAVERNTPYLETFDVSLNDWNIVNPDNLFSWERQIVSGTGGTLSMNLYDYENEGATDRIFSPKINTTVAAGLLLKFKLAHAHASGYDGDALSVYAQTGCSDDLANATRVYFKEGEALGTTTPTGSPFLPNLTSWKTQYVSLQSFLGNPFVRLAFVARNGFGNNLFIDSVQLIGEAITDLALLDVLEPSPVLCQSPVSPKLLLMNQGNVTISGFTVQTKLGAAIVASENYLEVLNSGDELEISLPELDINTSGSYTFLVSPIGLVDDNPSNNQIVLPLKWIVTQTEIPVRENFTNPTWQFVGSSGINWVSTQTNFGNSAMFPAFNNPMISAEAWLASPRLDFSRLVEASLFADFSYATNSPQNEFLRIMASEDCGITFDKLIWQGNASTFTDAVAADQWTPSQREHWSREYFNLNSLTGQDDILIAIQAVNGNGNNLFVDNIEFYENDNPQPTQINETFRVYSNTTLTQTFLTFNLEEQQPAEVIVSNMMGASVAQVFVDNALNQTLTFQIDTAPGIYIFRVRIGQVWSAVKQYIGN